MIKPILTAAAISFAAATAAWALPVLANRAASASRLIRRDPSRPWPLSWWRKELQQALQPQALQLSSRRRQVLLPQPLLGSPLLLSSLQLAGSRLHRRRSGLVLPVASD